MMKTQTLTRAKTIRLLHLLTNGSVDIKVVPNTLDSLQSLVGGYLESFQLPIVLRDHGLVGLCDEDGWNKPTPIRNPFSRYLFQNLVGPIIIVRYNSEGDFISLTKTHLDRLLPFVHAPNKDYLYY